MADALQILPGLFASPSRYLWHEPTRTAILSDLHLGIEASLWNQGIYLPDIATPLLKKRWEDLLARQPAQIVIAGDLFDVSAPAQRAIDVCRELLSQARCPILITPGNHDPDADALQQMLGGLNVKAHPFALAGNCLISHGHDMTLDEAAEHAKPIWIVGHQHPAVTLATRVQHAKMPCFALCRVTSNEPPLHVAILPAFSPAPLGSNLLIQNHWLLPIDRPPNDHIQIFGIIEPTDHPPQVLPFGPLSMLG